MKKGKTKKKMKIMEKMRRSERKEEEEEKRRKYFCNYTKSLYSQISTIILYPLGAHG